MNLQIKKVIFNILCDHTSFSKKKYDNVSIRRKFRQNQKNTFKFRKNLTKITKIT